MRLEDYPEADGKRMWLDEREIGRVLDVYRGEDVRRYLALAFAARSGLRRAEVVDVAPKDLVETEGGLRIRVQRGKGDKYRETPVPGDVYATASTFSDTLELDPDESIVGRAPRSLGRWIQEAGATLQEDTGDEAWRHLGMHDLRRSWAGLLVDAELSPFLIMEWGGWDDWRTFRDNYLQAPTAKRQREAVASVEWL